MQNEIDISSFNHAYHEEIKSYGLDMQIEFGFLYTSLLIRELSNLILIIRIPRSIYSIKIFMKSLLKKRMPIKFMF